MPGIGKEQELHMKSIARLTRATTYCLWRKLLSRFFFLLYIVTGCAKRFFMTLLTTRIASCTTCNINDRLAVVAAARSACAVWDAKRATFALCCTSGDQSVMASAFRGLRPVAAHSDYHGQDSTRKALFGQENPLDGRKERFSMDIGHHAEFPDCLDMSLGAIAFMAFEPIGRMGERQFLHMPIPSHLCDDRCK